MAKYNKIHYRDNEIKTIKQLFDAEKIVDITADDFLNEADPHTQIKNRDALFAAYTEQQKKDLGLNTSDDIKEDTQIYPPATLWVTIDKTTTNLITVESEFIQNKDFDAFLSEAQKSLINNTDYITSNVAKTYPEVTVWVWSKSFERSKVQADRIGGTIVNITDFIQDLKINVSESGGNFDFVIPPIPMRPQVMKNENANDAALQGGWQIDTTNQNKIIKDDGLIERVFKADEIHQNIANIYSGQSFGSTDNSIRSINIGTVGFSVNDIVFIKFERLKVERNIYINDLYVDPEALNGEVFDMIGLIDSIDVSTDINDVSISISGRDCMKLILDDGTFFFVNSYANPNSQSGVFKNVDENHGDGLNAYGSKYPIQQGSASRFILTGVIEGWWNPTARTISNVLDFLIKTLANIEICPDDLFESYGDKRTRFKKEKVKKK